MRSSPRPASLVAAAMAALAIAIASGGAPFAAGAAAADREAPIIESFIAPGVNRGEGGFDTASVIVPQGTYVTFLARSTPSLPGEPIQIWTRTASTDWTPTTVRTAAADGSVRYFARIAGWTAFRAVLPGTGPTPLAASHGRIANVARGSFALEVLPPEVPSTNRLAVPGQRYVFLVRIHDRQPSRGPIRLVASAPGAAAVSVSPALVTRPVVAEVTVVAGPVTVETDLRVTITATRAGAPGHAVRRTIPVIPRDGPDSQAAQEHLAPFLAWLAETHPALGLGPATPLRGTPASNVLVVTHYLFVSDEWEIGLRWHVMIAPHDWSRIYLRHRWTEAWPSRAFEITSVSAVSAPVEIAPPTSIFR